MPADILVETSKSSKSIIIPSKNHSNIEEMMMTTAAQIRDLKSGVSSSSAAAAAASQNVTESVPVPSSEHVAEIVGRQGCKIKALRAKTNTYIKTPVRGEAPMFVITGRKEDVHTAKREIQLAADHFSQIRARRGGAGTTTSGSGQQQLSPVGSNDLLSSAIKIEQSLNCSSSNNNASLLSSSSGSSSSSISVSPPTVSNISSSSSLSSCNHNHHHSQRSNSTSPNILIHKSMINDLHLNEQATDDIIGQLSSNSSSQQLQPGHIIKKVSVPYQVVGLVVGPKGSTIKRIQQNTQTYIVTPSRDSQPVFEIQGMPENVEAAKIEIENYIMLRTATVTTANSSSNSTTVQSVSPQPLNNDDLYLNFAATNNNNNNKLEFEFYNNVIDIIDDLKLISPHSSSLFKSVADVVNEEDSALFSSSQQHQQNSNIWSSPPTLSSASSTSSNSHLIMTSDDHLLFNALIKQEHRSSISSSSSESSSSSSTCNDVFNSNSSCTSSSQTTSSTLPLFINNNNNSFDFSIMSAFGSINDNHHKSIIGQNDPFLSSNSFASLNNNNNESTNAATASLNTLFQQHENLLLNNSSSKNNSNSNDSFNYLSSVTNDFNFLSLNQQQQPQSQQFY